MEEHKFHPIVEHIKTAIYAELDRQGVIYFFNDLEDPPHDDDRNNPIFDSGVNLPALIVSILRAVEKYGMDEAMIDAFITSTRINFVPNSYRAALRTMLPQVTDV